MKTIRPLLLLLPLGLLSCAAPTAGVNRPTAPAYADVEALERQTPVTQAPDDSQNATNAIIYNEGLPRYHRRRYYGGY